MARNSHIPLLPLKLSASTSSEDPPPSTSEQHGMPSWFTFQILPGLLLTTALSTFLIYTARTNKTFTGYPYDFVVSNRATIQTIVQILSQGLGLIHIFVLITVFNAFTRNWHSTRAVSLDCMKWWSSMCHLHFDATLPLNFILPLALFLAFSFFPAASWAGATTPIITTQTQIQNFSVPKYGPDPKAQFWNQSLAAENPNITRTALGSFSYNPVRNIVGSMLDEASLATAPNASFQTHRKLDNGGYLFRGRSYGIGASIGLANAPVAGNDVQQYSFFENGYLSNITCSYNRTMDFHVSLAQQNPSGTPNMYSACGAISDGSVECVTFPGFGDNEVVAMLGNPVDGNNQWGIATGIAATRYANLNQTSCQVVFNPMSFNASVDTVQRIINVTATGNVAPDIDSTSTGGGPANGLLSTNIVQQMGLIVQVSTSDQFSPFGNALISNIVNTNFSKINGYLPQTLDDDQISLSGIESALESMVDDILVAFSSAQFVIAAQDGGIEPTTMNATVVAIQIGDPIYIYTIAIINGLLLLLSVFEAVRNNGWRRLSAFDYRDLKSVVIGSSLSGGSLAADVLKRKTEIGERWRADPDDKVAGRTMVELDRKDGFILTLSVKKT